MDKLEITLTNCIKEIKAGKATLAECLDRYPSMRRELEPLLKIALNIQEPPVAKLDNSYKQASRTRLLRQIRDSEYKKPRSITGIFNFGVFRQFVWARVVVSVLAVVVAISMLVGGTVYAAQDSLPGEMLYPVKTATEDAGLLIAGDPSAKAKLNLQFAQTRLVEMSVVANVSNERAEMAVDGYRGNLNAAREQIIATDTSSVSGLLDLALSDIGNQMVFCDNVIDSKPKYLGSVEEASSLTIGAQLEFIRMLEQQNILQATEINLNAMQNRLQRAQAKSANSEFGIMQGALLQYQQFNQLGEEILQRAQGANNQSTEVEALSLQLLPGFLDSLNSIAHDSPQEYQDTIELCRQTTQQFRERAGYRYQYGQGPQPQTSESGDGFSAGQGGQGIPEYQGGNAGSGAPDDTSTPSPGAGGDSGSNSGSNGSGGSGGGNGFDPTPNPSPSQGSGSGST